MDKPVPHNICRIKTLKLGTPAADEGVANPYRVQIMEIEVFNNSATGDYTVNLSNAGDGAGKILVNGKEATLPLANTYPAGTKLALEAAPEDGSQFAGWSGNFSTNNRVAYVEVKKDLNLTANFKNLDIKVDPTENLAADKAVTAENSEGSSAQWNPNFLTDGKTQSEGKNQPNAGVKGYTSKVYPFSQYAGGDISANPHHITIDLGKDVTFSNVALYGRSDTDAKAEGSGLCANFPQNFNINVKADGEKEFTTVKTVTGQTDVPQDNNKRSYDLDTAVTARYIQIETTLLGAPSFDEGDQYSGGARVQLAEIAVLQSQ